MAKKEVISNTRTWRTSPRRVGEDFTGRRSLTVPDQSLTVKELVDKYSRGILDLPEADLFFLNDEEIPNWDWLPKIEQLEYATELRHLIAQRRSEYEKLRAEGIEVEDDELPNLPPQDTFEAPKKEDYEE